MPSRNLNIQLSEVVSKRSKVLVMLSGGADSVCLLKLATERCEHVEALHVNYGLRPESDDDEQFCAQLCDQLYVTLHVQTVTLTNVGNLHDEARNTRYEMAEHVRLERGLDLILTAHTASDQVETVLYRLAASPGRRALRGIAVERATIARPLLGVWAQEVREYCRDQNLEWREDSSNLDPRFARTRARYELIPAFEQLHPAAARNILRTSLEIAQEGELLDQLTAVVLERCIADSGRLDLSALASEQQALARLALRDYLESIGVEARVDNVFLKQLLVLATKGGTSQLDLPGGRVAVEYGILSRTSHQATPADLELSVPGEVTFGRWQIAARTGPAAGSRPTGGVEVKPRESQPLTIRARRPGDRIDPCGIEGHKSLQDLFVDRKIPTGERDAYPTVWSGDRIVWVPGLALSREHSADPGTECVLLTAAHATGHPDD